VALAAATTVKGVTIRALDANTDLIYVGDSSVSSANGYQLEAKESVSLPIADLATVWIDSAVNGEGVCSIKSYHQTRILLEYPFRFCSSSYVIIG